MSDKKKALETALTQIKKSYGEGAVMRLGENRTMNVAAISTGSISAWTAVSSAGETWLEACLSRGERASKMWVMTTMVTQVKSGETWVPFCHCIF